MMMYAGRQLMLHRVMVNPRVLEWSNDLQPIELDLSVSISAQPQAGTDDEMEYWAAVGDLS